MRYIPHTEQDIKLMLAEIGVLNIDVLFDSISDSLRLGDTLLGLPESLSESELTEYFKTAAEQKRYCRRLFRLSGSRGLSPLFSCID